MNEVIDAYTVEEIARALKLHPYTIRRLSREGKIPAFKFGGQWRFNKGEIQKWMNKGKKKRDNESPESISHASNSYSRPAVRRTFY